MPRNCRVKKEYRVLLVVGVAPRTRHEGVKEDLRLDIRLAPLSIDHCTNLVQL